MYKLINRFGFLLLALLVTTGLSSGRVQAHELEAANGYTAVLHIDPDDSPSAGEQTVLNFLIGKNGASYNKNDYSIRVEISADGVETRSVPVEP
ncbi:MAG: hypothetical protein ABIV43_04180, partial [Candidatus Saccharimonadales bacterium]